MNGAPRDGRPAPGPPVFVCPITERRQEDLALLKERIDAGKVTAVIDGT
jgi:hypothetical protein